jgi:RNA polymerase sigma factor (sigma-70 family)
MSKPSWERLRKEILSLLKRHAPQLSPQDQEDLAQDVLVKVFQSGRDSWPNAWLQTVIRHAIADWYRHLGGRSPTRERPSFTPLETLTEAFPDDRAERELRQGLATIDVQRLQRLWTDDRLLSEKEQTILHLVYYYDLSSAEIAKVVGMSAASTIRSLHKKLLDRLQYWLSESE